MTFLYPLGLLGLIGIPILILIYIIKSKYTEQTVSSVYLWKLSERFLKRKNPISRLSGIVSLILQLLAVTAISLTIAHPIITVPNSANEYCFILDASGSMSMVQDGKSRFDVGKEKISQTVTEAVDGSIFTLVVVDDATDVIFEKLDNKEQALALLAEVSGSDSQADYTDALGVAQGYFQESPSVLTQLITDKSYANTANVEIVNVSRNEVNFSLENLRYTNQNELLTVAGELKAYGQSAARTLHLYLNGNETPAATVTVEAADGVAVPFSLETAADGFSSLEVRIAEDDALAQDNRYVVYDVKSEPLYNTLIVSERPFFLRTILGTLISAEITTVSPEDYTSDMQGYGLYVFDSFSPEALPRDGAVWLINASASVEGAGFSVQADVELETGELLSRSTSSSSKLKELTADMLGEEIYVTRYIKYGLYRNFTTLYTHMGNPLVFAGTNDYGCRQIVMGFDLHDSNLPLLHDYALMMRNFVEYSFPEMIAKTTFACGESAEINVLANCDSIAVQSPNGHMTYLNTDAASDSLLLTEAGTYTVTVTVADSQREFNFFASMTATERDPVQEDAEFCLLGTADDGGFDGKFDPLMLLFIALAVLFLADWGMFCYDKYQLR